jgi:hypothetical protein
MSGGNVAHQVLDRLAKFEAQWSGKQNELVKKHNELASQIVAIEQIVKQVAAFTASEMGKFQGTAASHISALARSVSGLDLNILALAEMLKEVIGQLTHVDAIFKRVHVATTNILANSHGALSEDGNIRELKPEDLETFKNVLELSEQDMAKVKTDAEEWYQNLIMTAFKTAQERIATQEREALEREAKEKAEADKVAAAAAESENVEAELKKAADAERTIVTQTSGGPGTAFPEGADIFGG